MKAKVLAAFFVALLCSTSFAAIEWAGTPIIDLTAADLSVGPLTAWTNDGVDGLDFTNVGTGTAEVKAYVGLSGSTNYVNFDGESILEWAGTVPTDIGGDSDFTLEMWVRNVEPISGEETVVSWARRDMACGNTAQFGYGNSANSGAYVHWCNDAGYSTLPLLGRWHHIAYVNAGGTGATYSVYADGVLDSTNTWTLGIVRDAINKIALGSVKTGAVDNPYSGDRMFTGGLAGVRIHGGALTDVQVLNNYNEEKDTFEPAILGEIVKVEPRSNFIDFGMVTAGTGPSDPLMVTIKNDENALGNLILTDPFVVTGEFILGNPAPDYSDLAPGESMTFGVMFEPSTNDPQTGTLTIGSNDGDGDLVLDLFGNIPPIYVDGSVVVSGDGSQGNPFKTIQEAVDVAGDASRIVVAPGTYAGFTNPGIVTRVEADPIGGATINIVDDTITNTAAGCDLTLTGFDITGVASPGGANLIDSDGSLTIDQCNLTRDGNCIDHWVGDLTISNSTIVSGGLPGNYGDAECWLGGSAGTATLTHSSFSGAARENLNIWGFLEGGDLIIDRCYFEQTNCNGNMVNVWGDDTAGNMTITNSIFDYSSSGALNPIKLSAVDGNITVLHNTVVFNNGATPAGPCVNLVDSDGVKEVINNILVGGTAGVGELSGEGLETILNNFATADGDPGFVAPNPYDSATYVAGSGDFHLTSASPVIGAGYSVGVAIDYDGKGRNLIAPDIGAFEFAASATPTPRPISTGVDDWSLYE